MWLVPSHTHHTIKYKSKQTDQQTQFIFLRTEVFIKAEQGLASLNSFLVIIADFGLSKIVEHQVLMKTVCGTPGYCGMLFDTDILPSLKSIFI